MESKTCYKCGCILYSNDGEKHQREDGHTFCDVLCLNEYRADSSFAIDPIEPKEKQIKPEEKQKNKPTRKKKCDPQNQKTLPNKGTTIPGTTRHTVGLASGDDEDWLFKVGATGQNLKLSQSQSSPTIVEELAEDPVVFIARLAVTAHRNAEEEEARLRELAYERRRRLGIFLTL